MAAYKTEIFGPVLVCLDSPTLHSAVDLINQNDYGNGCAVFTKSGAAANYFQKHIEAGQVGINAAIPVPIPTFSFSGSKKSMLGGNYFYGKAGINFFTTWKTVTSLWKEEGVEEEIALSMPVQR